MTFNVVVSWVMTANIEVEAETFYEAYKKVERMWKGTDGPEPWNSITFSYGPEIKDGSFKIEGST